MTQVNFSSYDHYINDYNQEKPKQMMQKLLDMMVADGVKDGGACVDLGCASGELLYWIKRQYPNMSMTGVDLFSEFTADAKNHQPETEFLTESVLNLPESMNSKFDVTTAFGLMSLFDETQIEKFWDNLLRVTKPGGRIYVFTLMNEYGVDMMVRHRKRMKGQVTDCESAWNVHSIATITDILSARGQTGDFRPFQLSIPLEPREDPLRTWTMKTEKNDLQLTNGLKLLVNHYHLAVKKA